MKQKIKNAAKVPEQKGIIPFSFKRAAIFLSIFLFFSLVEAPQSVHADLLTIRPNTDGHELDYTPLSGTLHHAMVNDSSDSTYDFVGSQGQEDYWGVEDRTSEDGDINNVTVFLRVAHDTGGEEFRIKMYTYSTEYDNGADIADTTTFTDYSYIWATNPNTGLAWTWTEIDALEIGILSAKIGRYTGEQRVSNAWVVVDYTPFPDNPPAWSSLQVNVTKVYTGDSVEHSASWIDDSLSGFIFSWNATGSCDSDTWVNSTWQEMTGTSNTSIDVENILAACGGKTIGWRIYANDSIDQWNVTGIQTYDVYEYGWLSVSLITPTDPSNWVQNATYWVNATVTCEGSAGAECGTIQGGVRYNASGAAPDTLISTTVGDSPFYIIGNPNPQFCATELNQSDSCQLNFTVNTTGDIGSSYEMDANFTSSFDSSKVPESDSADSTVNIIYYFGWLNVSLITPVDPSDWVQNKTYWVNATVTCEGVGGAECGTIQGGVRYNSTGATPDTLISTTPGAAPFYVIGGSNPLSCPSVLNQGESCQLNFSVNATGALWTGYEIDVNFTSSFGAGSIPENDTGDSTVNIIYYFGWLNVSLITPLDPSDWVQNTTYWVNATVTCEGSTGAECGTIQGGVRYNSTGATPDTLMSETPGAFPFYVMGGSNPLSCPSLLFEGESCQLNFSVNTTGGIGSIYEIDANFSSSFGPINVQENKSLNSTIGIFDRFGWLNVSMITPIGTVDWVQNKTYWVNATVTCEGPEGAECGTIQGGVRYNGSSLSADTLISTTPGAIPFYVTGGSNPLSCETELNQSDSCQLNFSVNATGPLWTDYELDVNFTSSFGSGSVPENDTADTHVDIRGLYGWLNVSLITPLDLTGWVRNKTYWVNATVTCEGPQGGECGTVQGGVRYNASGATPDTLISTTLGAIPFYVLGGSNPLSCPSALSEGETCQLNFSVNATGDIGSSYEIGVNFTSSFGPTDVPGNSTDNSTIDVIDIYGWLSVSLINPKDSIDWVQNKTYWVNAKVTCEGPAGSECGTVQGGVRYNDSGVSPDTLVSTTFGAIPLSVIGTATHFYNFAGISSPSSTYLAEFGTGNSRPCAGLDCENLTEFSDTYAGAGLGGDYSNISAPGDESEAIYEHTIKNNYSLQRFRFVIGENVNSISELNMSWRGNASYWNAPDTVYLYAWNSIDWQLLGSHITGSADWINASFTDPTNITNFIDDASGYVYLLAMAETQGFPKLARVGTDFVEVSIEMTHQNPESCPLSLDEGESCQLNWPINVTGSSDWYEIDANFSSSFGTGNIPDNDTSDSAVHIITPSWNSYSDSGCSIEANTFYVGQTVYVCGIGFTPWGLYNVSIYDGADDQVYFGVDVLADSEGNLSDSYTISGGDTLGNWHSQVSIGPAPSTYSADDSNEAVEDLSEITFAFSVNVPEFAFFLIPFVVSSCVYLRMRRKVEASA